MPSEGGRRGRRDNGLDAASYVPLVDVDPRVGEHLLDVLASAGVPAFLEPSADVEPYTRALSLPSPPTDRLWVDREQRREAREIVDAETPHGTRPEPVPRDDEPSHGLSNLDEERAWRDIVAAWNAPAVEPTRPRQAGPPPAGGPGAPGGRGRPEDLGGPTTGPGTSPGPGGHGARGPGRADDPATRGRRYGTNEPGSTGPAAAPGRDGRDGGGRPGRTPGLGDTDSAGDRDGGDGGDGTARRDGTARPDRPRGPGDPEGSGDRGDRVGRAGPAAAGGRDSTAWPGSTAGRAGPGDSGDPGEAGDPAGRADAAGHDTTAWPGRSGAPDGSSGRDSTARRRGGRHAADRPPRLGLRRWRAARDTTPSGADLDRAAEARARAEEARDDDVWLDPDDDHFVPPPPPPVPRLSRHALLAVLVALFGVFLLAAPGVVGLDDRTGLTLGVAAILGGGALLVLRLRESRGDDGPDDGAVV